MEFSYAYIYAYLSNSVGGVVSNFKVLNIFGQFVYFMYVLSGFIGAHKTHKQARIYDNSNDGIGSTCIDNLRTQMKWRIWGFLASFLCFPFIILPLFVNIGLDIVARNLVIRAAIRARDRAKANQNTEAANDETFEAELDAA